MYNSDMSNNSYFQELTGLSGISSAFIRGYMEEYIRDGSSNRLRDCQEAGVKAVELLDKTIAIPTVSKRSRLLVDAGVVVRRKVGRSYVQSDGPNIDRFIQFLDKTPDYGTRISGSAEEDQQRTDAYAKIEDYGAIRVNGNNRIPTAAFKMLMGLVTSGKLDVVFLKPETVMGVKHDGQTNRITAE